MNRKSVTVDLPALDFRAEVDTVNDGDRTVEVKWSTGAAVMRFDYSAGGTYREELSLNPKHVRLDRLNGGAPVLNSHDSTSLEHQLGVVVEGSARIVGPTDARATLRFSKRASVEPFYADIKDRIIRNISVGYRVHKYEESTAADGTRIRTAIDWQPYELSIVPIGADAGAQTRSGVLTNPCIIVPTGATITDEPEPDSTTRAHEPIDKEQAFTMRLVSAANRALPLGQAPVALLEPADRIRLWHLCRAAALAEGATGEADMFSNMIGMATP